jgi:hypothetical protein
MTKYSIIITFWDSSDQLILEGGDAPSSKAELDEVLKSELSIEEQSSIQKVSCAVYASEDSRVLYKWLERDAVTFYEKGKWPCVY